MVENAFHSCLPFHPIAEEAGVKNRELYLKFS